MKIRFIGFLCNINWSHDWSLWYTFCNGGSQCFHVVDFSIVRREFQDDPPEEYWAVQFIFLWLHIIATHISFSRPIEKKVTPDAETIS